MAPSMLVVLVFGAIFVYPAVRLIGQTLGRSEQALPSISIDSSDMLLGKSILLAAAGSILSVVVGLPGAWLVGHAGRRWRDGLLLGLLLTPLLIPPMVYGFGWDRWFQQSPGRIGCVGVWAAWSWPIPAFALGAAWRRHGRGVYDQALIDTGPIRAFMYVALPALRRIIRAVILILFAFMLGDYAVPHACGVWVTATVLLDQASSTTDMSALLPGAWPVVAVIALVLIVALVRWPRQKPEHWDVITGGSRRIRWRGAILALGVPALTIALPLVGLIRNVNPTQAVVQTVSVYGPELIISISVAIGSGIYAVILGVSISRSAWIRAMALAITICWAAVPGALAGAALISAYLPFGFIYDHWPIMWFGYMARYGWIGVLLAWLMRASTDPDLIDQARLDGARESQITWRILAVSQAPLLAAGALIVASLCMSEVATTSLIQVPGITPVALLIVEKFHRFEDDFLLALSLLPSLIMLPGMMLLVAAARIRVTRKKLWEPA